MSVNKNMDVLVADKNTTMLGIIKGLLKEIGFNNIDEAPDGKEAFAKIQRKSYGLIISEWSMDNMNGLELLKAVRTAEAQYKDAPFIIVSSESKTENVIQAKEAGVSNYIVKPFNSQTLQSKIAAVMGEEF